MRIYQLIYKYMTICLKHLNILIDYIHLNSCYTKQLIELYSYNILLITIYLVRVRAHN